MNQMLALYGTSACHLCEEALALVQPLAQARGLNLTIIDISGDDILENQYGTSIPVLSRTDGEELCWPFDTNKVSEFLHFQKN